MEKQRVKASLFDKLPLIDKNRAAKFVIYGLIIAILFGVMMMVSRSVATNAGTWANLANHENDMAYARGAYGYNDYVLKGEQITSTEYWMQFQQVIFMNIARVGVNIGLLFVVIGFLSFAVNDNIQEKVRKTSMIIAGLILFLMMFTTFFSSVYVVVG
jgi:hypothetical protein